MEKKILVADDSPTIQKVISITLANTDFIVDSALNETELTDKVNDGGYGLILLDYNLSESKSGLDLAKEIKSLSSDSKIMAMLGTFDSVNDIELNEAGFSDQIVKPFESSKFIKKVESLFSNEAEESTNFSDSDIFSDNTSSEQVEGTDEDEGDSFDSDEWTMDSPDVVEETQEEESVLSSSDDSNPLSSEMADWGMSVPSVIGESESANEDKSLMPPMIGEDTEELEENLSDEDATKEFKLPDSMKAAQKEFAVEKEDAAPVADSPGEASESSQSSEEEQFFPEEDDLSYPSLGASEPDKSDEKEETDDTGRPQLTSLSELDFDDEGDDDIGDETNPEIFIEPQEDSPDLINELNDSISPDEFWAADQEDGEDVEIVHDTDLTDEFTVEEHPFVGEASAEDHREKSEATIDALNALSNSQGTSQGEVGPKLEAENIEVGPKLEKIDTKSLAEEIKKELMAELKPMIVSMVKEAITEANGAAIEKVAWEVIPDLAENLIKKEVSDISKKVLDKHSLN